MTDKSLIVQLMEAFRCLPGVGPKSAQRMTFYLLERNRKGGAQLAQVLLNAIEKIGNCERCRTLSETPICSICMSNHRNPSQLCIVETPADAQAIEQTAAYKGLYFVLMGHLSPLDGIGPKQIGLDVLADRLGAGEVAEVIVATNSTVEGEATAHYVAELARSRGITVTRIAQGVPFGGELEYVDMGTLSHAFLGRREL